ncbi:MAG: hypothetical protein J0H09_28805 [Burkholderiales bacterium]|nr:hypothetical protein [Burkholderiales bacterium]
MPISAHSASCHDDDYALSHDGGDAEAIELDSPEQIPELLAHAQQRILAARWHGRRVWIKGAASPHANAGYHLLSLFARLLSTPALSPVPAPGGESGIALEHSRLLALQRAGIRVPRVLARGSDWLCLSDLGQTALLTAIQRAPDASTRLNWWQQGLRKIVGAHARGVCLSQCFARNMIIGETTGDIGFVDFEDDPTSVMSLTHAQVRDWALYLFSTVFWLPDNTPGELRQRFAAALADEAPGVQHETIELLRRMRWLARLPRHPRWGRDVRLAQAAGDFARMMAGRG